MSAASQTTTTMTQTQMQMLNSVKSMEKQISHTHHSQTFFRAFSGDNISPHNSPPGSAHKRDSGNSGLIGLNSGKIRTNINGLIGMTAISEHGRFISGVDGQREHHNNHNHSGGGMYLSKFTHKYEECLKLLDEIYDIIFSYLNWFNTYTNESTLKLIKLRSFTHIKRNERIQTSQPPLNSGGMGLSQGGISQYSQQQQSIPAIGGGGGKTVSITHSHARQGSETELSFIGATQTATIGNQQHTSTGVVTLGPNRETTALHIDSIGNFTDAMLIDGVLVSEETHDARLSHYYEAWDDTFCDHLNDVYGCVKIRELKLYGDLCLFAWNGHTNDMRHVIGQRQSSITALLQSSGHSGNSTMINC